MEIIPAKMMGTDAQKSLALEDKLGRIFIASRSLLVFDGQTWKAYPKPTENALAFLVAGEDGILWTGFDGDLGFFREESFGEFKFHSLLAELPETARPLGVVWGCAPMGALTYFICQDKLLRWDGRGFQVSPFSGKYRLAPLRVGKEFWMQHLDTGLYLLTETGPELKFPADQLGASLIIALFRDDEGLVSVSNEGLRRPGQKPHSPVALNKYFTEHKVSAFCELPDGNLLFGTLSGGLVLTTRTGNIVRIWADSSSGLPGRTILGLSVGSGGEVLATTPTDFFHFSASGENTVFNNLNGLRGESVTALAFWNSTLYAATDDGAYRQVTADRSATFESIPKLGARYNSLAPHGSGLLVAKFGGVDWFEGEATQPALEIPTNSALEIIRSRADPNTFLITEFRGGVARLRQKPDGVFESERFLSLPDSPTSLFEAPDHRLWIGTPSRGVLVYAPAEKQLLPFDDPDTKRPFAGPVRVVGDDARLLFFLKGRVLQADARGANVQPVAGIPKFTSSMIKRLSGAAGLLVAYERTSLTGPLHGAGILSFGADGTAGWRELDLPHLSSIGSIRTAMFSEENGRTILWLGGIEGILRLDYDKVATQLPPDAPVIRVAGDTRLSPNAPIPEYPFKDHKVGLRVFAGGYVKGRDWLFQTRLGSGDGVWSAASPSRSFDYSNLSEGTYRFEVRAINTAGMASAASAFTFRILPPWYRSNGAYAGYAVALLAAVIGFIRIRERRIRARNEELEGLVSVRTAELVKANAAKDEFLAGISHEIRNPMNGVIGIAENFRTESLDLESRRKFNLLRQCATHLSSLLEDILDFSKVQAGALELDPKPFDLPELVESVAGITRADSEKYGIPVEVAISPAVPRKLVGDARRIRQILINFVSNALKFSGRGQVSVTVWCKEAGPGRSEVIFAVSDEGPGISPEEQTRLFTRFERGAAAQKGRVPGTGLGLALCKGLAEKMGGRIWLESELGRGSCFHFSAPFPVIETPEEALATPATAATAGARTALVVDDQEYNRIVLADLLQGMGFAVDSTQEGQAALDLAARKKFDVVFLDFNLPGLSGVDVARGIRKLPGPSAHALLLATTAFTTPEKRAQCLDAGMDAFLGKPVTRERLVKALAQLPSAPAAAPVSAVNEPPATYAKKADKPADPLGNLRLLARRKGVGVLDELALYFTELDEELAKLDAAISAENREEAGKYSHMLCGRCSFIYERELEQVQRRVEAAIEAGRWPEARTGSQEFAAQAAAAKIRLAASGSAAVPPASGR